MSPIGATLRVVAALASLAPAQAAILNLSNYGWTYPGGMIGTTQSTGSATVGQTLSASQSSPPCTDPSNCSTVSYASSVGFGSTALSFSTSAQCTSAVLCGPSALGYDFAESIFRSSSNQSEDQIDIGWNLNSGFLKLQYSAQGTIGGSGNSLGNVSFGIGYFINPPQVQVDLVYNPAINAVPFIDAGPSTFLQNGSTVNLIVVADPNTPNLWDYLVYGTAVIPVSGGGTVIQTDIDGASDVVGGGTATASASSFAYTGTLRVGGSAVYDSTGNSLVSGVPITSTSGFDYTQPVPASGVPEPSYTVLLFSAFCLLLVARNGRKSSHGL